MTQWSAVQSGADAAAEAAAAADLLIQHASIVRGKEAQSIVQQLITRVVAQQETQRSAQAQVCCPPVEHCLQTPLLAAVT